ncbi:MAG: hypothetical protein WDO15_21655 [Bacteroidota bacterium]
MKRLNTVLFTLLLSFFTHNLFAQSQSDIDFFAGKWSVLVKGTPSGDATMIFLLDKSDEGLTGVIQDTTGVEISKIDRVDLAPEKMTVYFNAQGYDVNVDLSKKDEDHISGSLLSMFTAEGTRKKK